MDILEKIVASKKSEVSQRKKVVDTHALEKSRYFSRSVLSMSKSLLDNAPYGIIAEFKRQSPSKGIINDTSDPAEVAQGYRDAGVAGMSVLTDKIYFGGSAADLSLVRDTIEIPILRKEFIIDEYQIIEARSMGADLILLIAEVLTREEVASLTMVAKSLGLEVLLEMHSESQLSKIDDRIDIVGINNRNLKTFEVDLDASIRLLEKLQGPFVKISESGLSNPANIRKLASSGFQGFLIGENFMKTDDPGKACQLFIENLRNEQA